MYINPKFRPLEPHLHHLPLESERGAWVGEHKHIFSYKRGSIAILRQVFFLKPKFYSETFSCFKNFTFHSFHPFSTSKFKAHRIKLKSFLHWSLYKDRQTHHGLHFTYTKNSWKWLHFGLRHFSWWFNMKNSTCVFMHQIWVFFIKTSV